ncbi:hypothetical protein SCP_1200120 [Sparassis crispa]|uniref:Myb-like domain-containing protein n=1 Tax=Sparassis crispa TaxID=139825 RepID=A0A401H048_9APHY|nr:hypothetical protein SCP_1200120 [Sparassis crispa]GBE87788.1 hypothetical protein SCP_1200120 [Sparassis crispa]
MDQYYQPLSHALNPPLVQSGRSPQHQYPANPYSSAPNGSTHREEEEEEEEDDEDIVEEELDHNEQRSPSHQSSPRTSAAQPNTGTTGPAANTANPKHATQDQHQQQSGDADGSEKRKPGRPRGSRNRKPRAPPGTSTKAPANTHHPGFYHYPPVPGGTIPQNQQFYEFQWRALNLCSEFYNAAEELVKAASPLVIAQCYQMGPTAKVDPLAMISEAKRVCDSLLANPSQLVGNPPPPVYSSMSPYPQISPSAPGPASTASGSSNANPVITNPQSFVMSLGTSAMPPPSHPPPHSQPFYPPPLYGPSGPRYPTAPYYSYQPQPPSYAYSTPPQAAPTAAAPAPPTAASTGTISTFNAATGSAAPGGQQGTWSEEETDRLKKLAEQSREMGGPQNKGEIEWDWVVQQWGNSRTRHQILLKATSMGIKESTTRGTKRRRDTESVARESDSTSHPTVNQAPATSAPAPAPAPAPVAVSPTQSPATPASANPPAASTMSMNPPSAPAARPAPSTPTTIAPVRTTTATNTSTMPWPMPTVAANTPSPVLANAQTESQRSSAYYRPRPTQTTSYGAAAAAANSPGSRPTSSQGTGGTTHQYMFRPNGAAGGDRR